MSIADQHSAAVEGWKNDSDSRIMSIKTDLVCYEAHFDQGTLNQMIKIDH